MPKKEIKKRLLKSCSICERKINLISYADKTYRGGHFFGKFTIRKKRIEYWECPPCYWRIKPQEQKIDFKKALKEVASGKIFGPYHSAKELKKALR
jgi:hypothetical protein